jgi:hypothetical protein
LNNLLQSATGGNLKMAGASAGQFGENSPQYVAWRLLEAIAKAEDRNIYRLVTGKQAADRAYILNTYAECLKAAMNERVKR